MKKILMLLILGSIILLGISLSGCFLIQNNSSNSSYFPEKTGKAQIAIYQEGSSAQYVTSVTFSNEKFNGHSDFSINLDVTENGEEVKENIFFWKNSLGELYLDGVKVYENYGDGSISQDTSIFNGIKLIDNANTGENRSPTNLTISGHDDNGNFESETILRTSQAMQSLTVQGKNYQDILKVKFSDPTNSENYVEVYFVKGVGIVRAIMSSSSSKIVLDIFNFQNDSTSVSVQKNSEKRVKTNNSFPFFFPFFKKTTQGRLTMLKI
ncbi:hypothetical protein [Mesoaciditoga sp.]